jgi:hypothetical protein
VTRRKGTAFVCLPQQPPSQHIAFAPDVPAATGGLAIMPSLADAADGFSLLTAWLRQEAPAQAVALARAAPSGARAVLVAAETVAGLALETVIAAGKALACGV